MTSFQEAYNQFVKKRGDLFEHSEFPMGDEEKKEVERLDRFSRKITSPVFLTAGCCAFIGSSYLFFTREWIFASGIVLCAIALVALSVHYKSYYRHLLQTGKKIVINGIITKIVKSSGYYGADSYGLTISKKETIFFNKEQVKGYKVGDIVRCETLNKNAEIRSKIERIGNIRD